MGFIDRLEQGLEKAVRGTFSKGGTFEPVDIANRLRTEMDNKAFSVSSGRTIAPNNFTAEFSASDFSRAQQWGVPLAEEPLRRGHPPRPRPGLLPARGGARDLLAQQRA